MPENQSPRAGNLPLIDDTLKIPVDIPQPRSVESALCMFHVILR
jgi:hypothetical protein